MMKKKKIVLVLLCVFVFFSVNVEAGFVPYDTLEFGGKTEVTTPANFELQPNDQTVNDGDIFYINVYVTPNSTIDTCAVDNLTFTSGILEVVSVSQGDLFGGTTMWTPYTEINNNSGYVKGILWTWTGETNTPGVFCNITFKAVNPGVGYVNITEYGVARDGVDITCTIKSNSTATVEGQQFTPYDTLSFGGKVTVNEGTIDIDVTPDTWDAGNPSCGSSTTENFTFYQNGTAIIDIKIGFNETNYTFVTYSTWQSNGHDQYCANFTTDTWGSETNIAPKVGGVPVTALKTSVNGNSNFAFGLRIYMPKTVSTASLREDFKVMFNATKS